jgi:hypothetical protein
MVRNRPGTIDSAGDCGRPMIRQHHVQPCHCERSEAISNVPCACSSRPSLRAQRSNLQRSERLLVPREIASLRLQ